MYRFLSAAKQIASPPCPRRLTEASATGEPAWPFFLRLAPRQPDRKPQTPSDLVGATGFEPVTPCLSDATEPSPDVAQRRPVSISVGSPFGSPELSLAELIGGTGLREDACGYAIRHDHRMRPIRHGATAQEQPD